MTIPEPFSRRFGHAPADAPISITDDAPPNLRFGILHIAHDELNMAPKTLREIACGVLRRRPDESNWSEYPNVWSEVQNLVEGSEWFRVYDIVEAIHRRLAPPRNTQFADAINALYREMGVGWQLINGQHQIRGDSAFESTLAGARAAVSAADMPTAQSELSEALEDLSRRPTADLSGAIHHAYAALECIARRATGDEKSTLGEILKRHPDLIPKPLDDAISKAWGFASENARHGREGRTLDRDVAVLIVAMAAAVSAYLAAKLPE